MKIWIFTFWQIRVPYGVYYHRSHKKIGVVIVNWFPRGASRYECCGENNKTLKWSAKLALILNKFHEHTPWPIPNSQIIFLKNILTK